MTAPRGGKGPVSLSGRDLERLLALSGLNLDLEALSRLPEAQRLVVAEELQALERLFRENPLLGFRPHGKQRAFMSPPFPPLRAFFGGNRCLAEGTLVRMADGSERRIERVQVGELVLGSDEAGVCRPVRVLDVAANGPRTCFRFRFGKRGTVEELVATADHRVSAWHEKGFRVVLPLGLMDGTTRSRWSVQRSTGVVGAGGELESAALLLGLLLGDGCTVNGRVSFTCDDPDVLELLAWECASAGVTVRQNAGNRIQYNLSTGPPGIRNRLSARLEELGMACYAHEKRLPDMSGWSDGSAGNLIAGLLVTDGSVWKASEGWRLGYTSVSRGLVEDVKRELEQRWGVYGSTLLTNDRSDRPGRRVEYSLTIGNYASLMRLSFSIPAFAKLKKLRTALGNWEGKKSDAARLRYRGREDAGVLPTYDLHVDHPDHLFVLANGMVVHNSGKTTCAIVDTVLQVIDRDQVPKHLASYKRWEPPCFVRVVTPDLTSTLDGVIHEKIRDWCPPSQLKGGSFGAAFDKQQRVLHFKNRSRIQFNSSEQDREKLGGVALHRVVYDEEPRREVREECSTRLIDFNGEELFALTPFQGMAWLFDEVYEPWERGEMPADEGRVVVVDMDDNPHLSDEGKARRLSKLSGPEREARKSGRFVSFAGLIYPQFSEETHLLPALEELPAGVEVFRGIDPGYRHMCGVLYCYLDEHDDLVVFDEIAMRAATVKQVCREMSIRDARWGVERNGTRYPLQPNWTVIDPASRNKNTQTGRSDQQEFVDNGVPTIPGQNAVGAGINRVKERLDVPKLHVTANCRELVREFKRYRWQKVEDRTENESREAPVKRDDHLLDCLRYVCMQRPLAPEHDRPRDHEPYERRALRAHLKRLGSVGSRRTVDTGFGPGQFH